MGLGQTMLTSLVLVLLSLAVISGNRLMLDKDQSFYEQEAYKQAGILANALLQEIVRKKFDSSVDTSDTYYMNTTEFNSPGSLGPSSNAASYVNPGGAADVFPYKSIKNTDGNYFDDIDDYKGYKRSASVGNLTGFILTVDVYYVRLSGGLYVKANTNAQYWKKIDVAVTNSKYLINKNSTLTFSTIVAY